MLLFLNDIAGSEVLVILIFILIFFGSKSIPGIAKSLGQTMRQIRDASNELQHEIKKSGMDIKKDINLSSFVDDTVKEIQQPLDQYVEDIEHAVRYEAPKRSHLNQAALDAEAQSVVPESSQPVIKSAQDQPDLTQQ